MKGDEDGAAIANDAIDRAAALLRQTRELMPAREICYRRLVDLALCTEGRRVIDGPALHARLGIAGQRTWRAIREDLEALHLITVTPGRGGACTIAVPLVDEFGS